MYIICLNILINTSGASNVPIGDTIKALRQIKGLSQTALAQQAGLCRVTVCRIENYVISCPDTRTIKRIAKVLQVSPGVLLG
jgi:transcriptional regulator with XRE-family HTH domain